MHSNTHWINKSSKQRVGKRKEQKKKQKQKTNELPVVFFWASFLGRPTIILPPLSRSRWRSMCSFNLSWRENVFWHRWHSKGRSPVWTLRWRFKWAERANGAEQMSQRNGFSPVWARMWARNSAVLLQSLKQKGQTACTTTDPLWSSSMENGYWPGSSPSTSPSSLAASVTSATSRIDSLLTSTGTGDVGVDDDFLAESSLGISFSSSLASPLRSSGVELRTVSAPTF